MASLLRDLERGQFSLRKLGQSFLNFAREPATDLLGGLFGDLGDAIFGGGRQAPFGRPQDLAFGLVDLSGLKFQHGGAFDVAGGGGTDSELVSFLATPGEHVEVTPPGEEAEGVVINSTVNFYITTGVAAAVRAEVMNLMPLIKEQVIAALVEAVARGQFRGVFGR